MWTVTEIAEADFGCEDRLPGQPLLVLVTIENEYGDIRHFECADEWLVMQEIDEGDEWPEDVEEMDMTNVVNISAVEMQNWMEKYSEALEELEGGDMK